MLHDGWQYGRIRELIESFYRTIVKKRTGKFVATKIKVGGATDSSAMQFWKLQKSTGRSVAELMTAAFDRFSTSWCVQRFKRPYPPLPITIGPKSRQWLAHTFHPVIELDEATLIKTAAEIAEMIINSMGKEGAQECVESGWPLDKQVREKVKEIVNS